MLPCIDYLENGVLTIILLSTQHYNVDINNIVLKIMVYVMVSNTPNSLLFLSKQYMY